MKYDEFRDWLRSRGGKSNSVNTRSAAVRKLESEMAALGSPYSDLDAAYRHDQFAQLRQSLDDMRLDLRNGGAGYRVLFPNSNDPINRIANSRAWLGQYGQFLGAGNHIEDYGLKSDEGYWLVGGSFGGKDDQVPRFLADGIWEINTPKAHDAAAVRSMKIGDRIAVKASFVQRRNLPFDNRDLRVSVMRIKARGVITDNAGDGERVSVSWDEEFEAKDWYFYTYRPTVWEVHPGNELAAKLIAFTFFDEPQDISWFRNHSSWSNLFGDNALPTTQRFWIEKTIVAGRADREAGENSVGHALWSPQRSKDGKNIYSNMLEVQPGDVVFHLTDNEAITAVSVAATVADTEFTTVAESEWDKQPGFRIELKACEVFDPKLPRKAFLDTEPFATELRELAGSGAKGLFYNSLLDLNQGAYLTEATPTLLSILNRAYQAFAGRGLPHFSVDAPQAAEEVMTAYTLEDALEELFLESAQAQSILRLWSARKNIILQGPPGVGKSFAAQKLAFALIGAEDRSRFGFVQFHQSYSYEDFVEGYRPTATGFELRAGKFVEFCRRAEADPNQTYVYVIDEINRGNLSKILGELMLLIEYDKRDEKWALPLSAGKVLFHVPSNVHLMGLMNTADRSLAVVDYALRRRFAFVDIEPSLHSSKFRGLLSGYGFGNDLIEALISRIGMLNHDIVSDVANLGPGFAIGHSFFCNAPTPEEEPRSWYDRIISTEILPLLREYWFDAPSKASDWEERLLAPL
jgi:hypothetical protein